MWNRLGAFALSLAALLLVAVIIISSIDRKRDQQQQTGEPDANDAVSDVGDVEIDDDAEIGGGDAEIDDAGAAADKIPLDGLSGESFGWGVGPSRNELNQPTDAVAKEDALSRLGAHFIYHDSTSIYLTFDLGYENGYTEKILDTLAEKGVKATFFITGDFLDDRPDIVQRIIDDGHTLGNHSENHKILPELGDAAAEAEVTVLGDRVREQFGYDMKLFRFPTGAYSERSLALVNNLGCESIFWSFAYVDWRTDAQPEQNSALSKLIASAHPGAIYLLHAVSSTNAAILPQFIDRMTAEGYKFEAIPNGPAGDGDPLSFFVY